jgi:murein DD-endopeptidase MepM/ murein hydrolase activator NlpD
LNEVKYMKEKISFILEARQQKYAIPVEWKELSHNHSKIPNSGRPYRAEYTDGIHHGWDIDADFWEQVVALDDGIIVRVVSEFEFHDLWALKKWEGLTQDDKVKNLDILRGKQVWLKTMKWDVVFYSHLDDIFTNIKEWVVVTKWQPLGTVGITWVPDKEYNDYHLHFPIHENPFHEDKIGRYTYDDYMKWRWKFQWQSADFIIEHQYDVFEK